MNLNNNYKEIIYDPTLMESTLMAFSETWLEEKTSFNFNILGYQSHFNSIGPGKGLALYYKEGTFKPTIDIKREKMQISKLEAAESHVISVYRSEQGNLTELIERLENLITPGVTTVVCGDFNFCYIANRNNKVTKFLENTGFSQLMKDPTHIKGRLLDHFYFKSGENKIESPSMFRYSPYYSDHDAICATPTQSES